MAELRPFTIQDESARYWSRRLSWLSSLIGYGLIVAVPIISNQVNVQIGALANVIIMLCMTVWALYLIFRNKTRLPSICSTLRSIRWPFQPVVPVAPCAGVALAGKRRFIVLFFFSLFDPGNSLKFYDWCNSAQPGDYWYRSICFRYVFPLAGKNHHSLATYSA